jgi:hypothetical protein
MRRVYQSTLVTRDKVQNRSTAWPARCLLLVLIVLSGWSFVIGRQLQPPPPPSPKATTDGTLYRAIDHRMALGEGYYAAAIAEHRAHQFPLRPSVTVRPPLLAEITTAIGGPNAMGWLLRLTGLVTFLALAARFASSIKGAPTRIAATVIAAFSIAMLTPIDLAIYHDIWAGILVALALVLRRPDRWLASVVVAFLAVSIRELAAPILIVMAASAAYERRWHEAAAWLAALGLSAALLALHWHQVAALTAPGDLTSPGWLRALGWPWVVHIFSMTNAIQIFPTAIGAALVPVAIFGWATAERGLAIRVSLWIFGMACVFMVFGRSENYYWGALVAPILPIGLAFAPTGVARVVRLAR